MSQTFKQMLQELNVKFLGIVPAKSIVPKNDENDDIDPLADLGMDDELEDKGDFDFPDSEDSGDMNSNKEAQDGDDNIDIGVDATTADEEGDDADPSMDDQTEQDPDRMGDIRVVKGAHLVYKRQQSDGSFSELWIYNIGEHVNDAIAIKRAILAGTDIQDNKMRSEDGKQCYELTSMGNAQLLSIEGLSN